MKNDQKKISKKLKNHQRKRYIPTNANVGGPLTQTLVPTNTSVSGTTNANVGILKPSLSRGYMCAKTDSAQLSSNIKKEYSMNNQIPDQEFIASRDKASKAIKEMTNKWAEEDFNWPETERLMLDMVGPMVFEKFEPKHWPRMILCMYHGLNARWN